MREKTAEVIAQTKFEKQGGNRLLTNKDLKKLIIPLIIEQILAVSVGMVDTIMAVSYTHLDVYKRQHLTGPPGPGFHLHTLPQPDFVSCEQFT